MTQAQFLIRDSTCRTWSARDLGLSVNSLYHCASVYTVPVYESISMWSCTLQLS